MKQRDFDEKVKKIQAVSDNKEFNKLLDDAKHWAPNIRERQLRGYVNLYFHWNYEDLTSVRVYAAFWGCTRKVAKVRMRKKAKKH